MTFRQSACIDQILLLLFVRLLGNVALQVLAVYLFRLT